MFTTIVAVLCHLSGPATGACVEEIVSDSDMDPALTFQACMISGQAGIAKWMSEHPLYRSGWRLDRYKCAPGHYEIHGRA
jgi:hypothetical protein